MVGSLAIRGAEVLDAARRMRMVSVAIEQVRNQIRSSGAGLVGEHAHFARDLNDSADHVARILTDTTENVFNSYALALVDVVEKVSEADWQLAHSAPRRLLGFDPIAGVIDASRDRYEAEMARAQAIVNQAQSHAIGSWGGQCKVWAAKVINDYLKSIGSSKHVGGYESPGGAYYGAYKQAGGIQVPLDQVRPGDLIQTINPDYLTSNDPPIAGLHTMIVVRVDPDGSIVVRDSNAKAPPPERVHEHVWNQDYTKKQGGQAYVWRFTG